MRKREFKLWIAAFNARSTWMRMWSFEPSTILNLVVPHGRGRTPNILPNLGHTIMADNSGSTRLLATNGRSFESLVKHVLPREFQPLMDHLLRQGIVPQTELLLCTGV